MTWKSAVRRWIYVSAAALSMLLLCGRLAAQNFVPDRDSTHSQGLPVIRNYPPEEYGAHNQNWAIAQDKRGVMYFGNSKGLLEYDGVSWRLIPLNQARIARSLAISADDRVFVGGYGIIGYLAPDSARQLQLVSLLPQLDASLRDFKDVWQTLATPEGVFFITEKYIFCWDGQKMRSWRAQTVFQSGYWVNNQLYVIQREIGLMQIISDSLRIAPQGEKLADVLVSSMLPFGGQNQQRTLIATRDNGLLLYDGRSVERFPTEADALLMSQQVFCATALSGGRYAFGTMQGGVVVVDGKGQFQQRMYESTGLQDDAVLALFEDRQRALWIGMQVGIARAETGSPFSYFGAKEGIEGSIWDIVRHEGRLYFATIMGLYYLDSGGGRFKQVAGVSPQCWTLQPFGQSLLAGTFDGVYEIRGEQVRRITEGFVFALHRSKQDPNRVFAGMRRGVKSLYYEGGQWRDEGLLENLDYEVRHFYETPEGKLWLIDYFSELIQVDFSKGYTRQPPIARFDTLHGLPPADRIIAFPTDKGLRFATLHGIFAFDAARQRFYRDSTLVRELPDPKIALFFAGRDRRGNLWLVADDNKQSGVAMRQSEGVYVWDQSPFLRIAETPVYTAYPDPVEDQITWIGGTDEVMRYNGAIPSNHAVDFPTLIRQVVINGDSILYGGAGRAANGNPRLVYANNSLRFRYAAPSFDEESKTEFQYMLEGFDDDWSSWSTESYKDYTGLPPGEYRFMVRAKNIYQRLGQTAVFEFRILPPFYLTWWAYAFYVLLIAGIVAGVWKFQLERIRLKHTREIKQLEYEKLKELDQMKSRFFADISHEFRTPLTLILGPLNELIANQTQEDTANQYLMMKRNAQRLLRLINQLLDLSKLDAGKMSLELEHQDIIPLLRGICHAFESLVQSKKVSLFFESEMQSASFPFDRDKMEQIFINLVSNAIKFVPEGGTVQVQVKKAQDGDDLQIDVADTGPGISEDQLLHVFDRFYQGSEASRVGEPGSGIGLALVKELVALHRGKISVSSRENEGTRFSMFFPYSFDFQAIEETVTEDNASLISRIEDISDQAPASVLATAPEELASENTLLLVEDNPDMRAFMRGILAGNYRVLEAIDGQEGVEKALEHIPDIIISDVMMPRMDGLQLCDTLKNDERTSHIPVILLTAKADLESRVAGLRRGADDYLSKPFNREELLVRAHNLLTQRQRLRARYASLEVPAPAADKGVEMEDAFLQKIRQLAESRLSDPVFDIDQLAKLAGMSRSQMFRKMKALTGKSPSLFIRDIRLHRAKELLETTKMNVSEIAYEVGFSTLPYFSDAFVEAFGVRPSQFRK